MSDVSDKSLQGIITIAQSLLLAEKDVNPVTTLVIEEKVKIAAGLVTGGQDLIPKAVSELIRRFSLWIGQDSSLVDKEGHEPWLDASRKRDWRYWQRYQAYLERKMSGTAVDALNKSTDKILGLLEDPLREGWWDRRGLVVGHVQSGKTASYSGLICKAADAGYKIIIVLAGLHNNLRSQTQIRLEEAFLGYKTPISEDSIIPVGVGLIDSDSRILPNCATNRKNSGDFTTRIAQHCSISPEQRPWLFVVKKNKTVLERLLKWIRNHVADTTDSVTGRRIVTALPLLLIDDEADNASVDTGEQTFNEDGMPDEEHQPKAINRGIRKILHSFARSAYVGYTATPFANIFIHRRNSTPETGPDLFPQSFIINLAAPSNYVGPSRVFGLRSIDGRSGSLPLVREFEDHTGEENIGGWMPPKHNKEHIPIFDGADTIPDSLKEAIYSFILATATKVVRGLGREHSSMLIHVTRFTMVQSKVHYQVREFVGKLRQHITRQIDHEIILNQLEQLWVTDFQPVSVELKPLLDKEEGASLLLPTWAEIVDVLPDVLDDIEVRMINGTAKDALDYDEQSSKGLKVIAIGGDKLARGLTLEGLCSSYFVRTTKMYDTLMQMGRWFGYRPGYLDVCRLYTTHDLIEWFGHIADASEELRQEFDAMAESGGTPKEYGLKVQSHPVLMVTSPIKMRSAKSIQLTFSGDLLETVAFHQETAVLEANLAAVESLLSSVGAPKEKDLIVRERPNKAGFDRWKGHLWEDVPFDDVCDFFTCYTTHPMSRKVNSALISEFIKKMAEDGELNSWTVALLGGGSGQPWEFSNGLRIENMLIRKRDEKISDRYSIGRLMSPKDEAIDLNLDEWTAALLKTIASWRPDAGMQVTSVEPTPPEVPNGPAIRSLRGFGADGIKPNPQRGVLLIYLLDSTHPDGANLSHADHPVVGFGVSFPASQSTTKVVYEVDHLMWESWRNEYGSVD